MPRHPTTMNAIAIAAFGGPEVLRLAARPVAAPRAGEVLVRVTAEGVYRPDLMQCEGKYPPPPGASDIPGLEIAGEVVDELDSGGVRAGQKICALVSGGGYAEYCTVPAVQCLP